MDDTFLGDTRLSRRDGYGYEHSYPTPTRGLLKATRKRQANLNPVSSGRRTVATRVRHGRIMPDGTRVYFNGPEPNEHDLTVREQERANVAEERRQRKARIAAMVANNTANTDHWSSGN